MSRKKKNNPLVGKIGWCDASTLGLSRGHFVFIRRVYGNKCSINTFTSLKTNNGLFKYNKMPDIESGKIYPIPTKDVSLPRFSGIHKNSITNVPISEVKNIDRYRLKRRHHRFIQKYVKK